MPVLSCAWPVVLNAEAKPLWLGLRLITQQSRAPCSPSQIINMSNNTSVATLIGGDKKDEWSWFYSPALAHSGSITWIKQTSKQTFLFSVKWHSISKVIFLIQFTLILIRILIKYIGIKLCIIKCTFGEKLLFYLLNNNLIVYCRNLYILYEIFKFKINNNNIIWF